MIERAFLCDQILSARLVVVRPNYVSRVPWLLSPSARGIGLSLCPRSEWPHVGCAVTSLARFDALDNPRVEGCFNHAPGRIPSLWRVPRLRGVLSQSEAIDLCRSGRRVKRG